MKCPKCKKIIYRIWYYFHCAITHRLVADSIYRDECGYPKFSHSPTDTGIWGRCNCGKSLEDIYKEFYLLEK